MLLVALRDVLSTRLADALRLLLGLHEVVIAVKINVVVHHVLKQNFVRGLEVVQQLLDPARV